MSQDGQNPQWDEEVATRERAKTAKPRMFRVLLHNDDYTTMEFVVHVLVTHFHKSETQANQVMLAVHHKGIGIAGIYTFDIAQTKINQVTQQAHKEGFPLKVTMEPE